MKPLAIILSLALILTSFASAETFYAGNNYTFTLDTNENLYWDVVGNSSDLDLFQISQEVYGTTSNITYSIDYRMKPDNFTLIIFSERTNEVIVEVPVNQGGSSGGSPRVVYKNKTIIKEIPKIIYETNQTCEDCEKLIDDKIVMPNVFKDAYDSVIGFFKSIGRWLKNIFT